MTNCFNLLFLALAWNGLLSVGFAETSNTNSLLQIAQGDKLVLKKDFVIPANTERLNFGVKVDVGYRYAGCAVVVNPSQKSRKLLAGAEIVFSGISKKLQTKDEFKEFIYTFIAEVMNSETVMALECYGTSFESQYKDLYVSGIRERLKEFFVFVPAEPEIVH
ncbi:MAG: hypothetical protein ACKOA8_03095 [Deltaproteobacteria bacterium]